MNVQHISWLQKTVNCGLSTQCRWLFPVDASRITISTLTTAIHLMFMRNVRKVIVGAIDEMKILTIRRSHFLSWMKPMTRLLLWHARHWPSQSTAFRPQVQRRTSKSRIPLPVIFDLPVKSSLLYDGTIPVIPVLLGRDMSIKSIDQSDRSLFLPLENIMFMNLLGSMVKKNSFAFDR